MSLRSLTLNKGLINPYSLKLDPSSKLIMQLFGLSSYTAPKIDLIIKMLGSRVNPGLVHNCDYQKKRNRETFCPSDGG